MGIRFLAERFLPCPVSHRKGAVELTGQGGKKNIRIEEEPVHSLILRRWWLVRDIVNVEIQLLHFFAGAPVIFWVDRAV